MQTRFKPKILTVLGEGYTRHLFLRDLGAGSTIDQALERARKLTARPDARPQASEGRVIRPRRRGMVP